MCIKPSKAILISFVILLLILPFYTVNSEEDEFSFSPMRKKYSYVEEYYLLYKESLQETSDSMLVRLRYLHLAAQSNFDHPIRAFTHVQNEQEYETYQYLMYFHIAFLITKTYAEFGAHFDMDNLYWYNTHYYPEIEEGFIVARTSYEMALYYWQKTKELAVGCWNRRQYNLPGTLMDNIENDVYMVMMVKEYAELNWENLNDNNREVYLDYDYDHMLQTRLTELNEKWAKLQELKDQYIEEGREYPDYENQWEDWDVNNPTPFYQLIENND
jgi:hypothetical protein